MPLVAVQSVLTSRGSLDVCHLCRKELSRHSNEVSSVQLVRGELEHMLDSAACAYECIIFSSPFQYD